VDQAFGIKLKPAGHLDEVLMSSRKW